MKKKLLKRKVRALKRELNTAYWLAKFNGVTTEAWANTADTIAMMLVAEVHNNEITKLTEEDTKK